MHRLRPPGLVRLSKSTLLFELDDQFQAILADGASRAGAGPTGDGEGSVRVIQRLYNLAQCVDFTAGVKGLVVECGCYRGLSSYVLSRYLAAEDPAFTGASVHVFDSFEGLSPLGDHDTKRDPRVQAGMFAASLDVVRQTLADFPDITFHPGWIPASLAGAPLGPYRLVHVDLDLHDPTRAALEYFYPLLAGGGVLVCDDFGSVRWPGARTAVEDFCSETGARLLRLSSGQALVLGPDSP
ncbi:MAG: O-methyltransferase [Actinomycetota bacterium]|nr:O-methyltransferase [Actinomycetota bacterium]